MEMLKLHLKVDERSSVFSSNVRHSSLAACYFLISLYLFVEFCVQVHERTG